MRRLPYVLLSTLLASCDTSTDQPEPAAPDPVANTVVVTPGALTLQVGAEGRFTADVRDAAGNALTTLQVAWSSSPRSVVQVGADGAVSALGAGTAVVTAAAGGKTGSATVLVESNTYDLDALGVPRIITADYIELAKLSQISRFRSGFGHDYSDSREQCRSMKHYFQPPSGIDWGAVVISAPASGVVASMQSEQTFGTQIRITPTALGAATIVIFHVMPDAGLAVGSMVTAGGRLGTHIGSQTLSDIAVRIDTPTGQRLVSYFDAMTDAVFAGYQARGVASRAAMVITDAERNASPLSCTGETFIDGGTIANWVLLTP